ncbi:MAG: hypothetical protein ACXWX1_13345, partial [Aeromicrobium sp.]
MGRLRSFRQRGGPLALAAILATSVASTAAAGSPGGGAERRAQLDGHAISLADVARFQCHDRDFPVIRCFTSAAERDRDMVALGSSAEIQSATHYVTWYDGANYPEPPSFAAYWSEPDLTIYGWNDKISSFRTYNGGHPRWWQDVGNKGSGWDWGTSSMAYVGDAANDQFSGVERL